MGAFPFKTAKYNKEHQFRNLVHKKRGFLF